MKHKTLLVVAAAAAVVSLSGCDSVNNFMNERSETVEYYRIYDIKTDAKIKPVADAALKGLTYTTTPKVTRHIPKWKTLPDEPGRFETADMFNSNSNLARLMASSGAQSKIATCDGAVWTAVADRGSSSDGAKLFALLVAVQRRLSPRYVCNFHQAFGRRSGRDFSSGSIRYGRNP